jgi:hypothetical protein
MEEIQDALHVFFLVVISQESREDTDATTLRHKFTIPAKNGIINERIWDQNLGLYSVVKI